MLAKKTFKSPCMDSTPIAIYDNRLYNKCNYLLFPTCQVRVVRFYVSCLLLSSSPLLLSSPPPPAQPRPSTHSVSLSDLNHDHPRPVFPAGPQPRPSPPSVPCRTSTTTIHAQCSLPDLNREYPRQVFPAGPHVGRYGTKNVQKKYQIECQKICQIECQKVCQIECQIKYQIDCHKICQIESQKICQITCQKICQNAR